jgi:hypothetical protein
VRNLSGPDWPPKLPGPGWPPMPPDAFAEFRQPRRKPKKLQKNRQRHRNPRVLRLPTAPLARTAVVISAHLVALLIVFVLAIIVLQL